PGPAGAARPGGVPGPDPLLHPLQVGCAEAPMLRRSAAGPAAVDGPDASLRHAYRPSPTVSMLAAVKAMAGFSPCPRQRMNLREDISIANFMLSPSPTRCPERPASVPLKSVSQVVRPDARIVPTVPE